MRSLWREDCKGSVYYMGFTIIRENNAMMRRITDNKRILLLLSGLVIFGVILACIFSFSRQDSHRIYPVNGTLDL